MDLHLQLHTDDLGLFLHDETANINAPLEAVTDAFQSSWSDPKANEIIAGFSGGTLYLGTVDRDDTLVDLSVNQFESEPSIIESAWQQVFHGSLTIYSRSLKIGGTLDYPTAKLPVAPGKYGVRVLVPPVAPEHAGMAEPPMIVSVQLWPSGHQDQRT